MGLLTAQKGKLIGWISEMISQAEPELVVYAAEIEGKLAAIKHLQDSSNALKDDSSDVSQTPRAFSKQVAAYRKELGVKKVEKKALELRLEHQKLAHQNLRLACEDMEQLFQKAVELQSEVKGLKKQIGACKASVHQGGAKQRCASLMPQGRNAHHLRRTSTQKADISLAEAREVRRASNLPERMITQLQAAVEELQRESAQVNINLKENSTKLGELQKSVRAYDKKLERLQAAARKANNDLNRFYKRCSPGAPGTKGEKVIIVKPSQKKHHEDLVAKAKQMIVASKQ